MKRWTCHFSGRVQGVGFRYTASNIARQHDVGGYVRNLSDGRVELVMEGPQQELEQVLAAIGREMEGYIRHVDRQESAATGDLKNFSIRH